MFEFLEGFHCNVVRDVISCPFTLGALLQYLATLCKLYKLRSDECGRKMIAHGSWVRIWTKAVVVAAYLTPCREVLGQSIPRKSAGTAVAAA
jgi:hypothetical protein